MLLALESDGVVLGLLRGRQHAAHRSEPHDVDAAVLGLLPNELHAGQLFRLHVCSVLHRPAAVVVEPLDPNP